MVYTWRTNPEGQKMTEWEHYQDANARANDEYERVLNEVEAMAGDPYGLREYALRRARSIDRSVSYPEIPLHTSDGTGVRSKKTTIDMREIA